MIFRRRRTRIEIAHTIVTVEGGIPRPASVTPSTMGQVESALARALSLPLRRLKHPAIGVDLLPPTIAQKTKLTSTTQETLP
jgi:hypothetical protein